MAPSRALLAQPAHLLRSRARARAPSRVRLPGPASYHSDEHGPAAAPFGSAAERAILSAAYARVPEHGFTPQALSLGARDAGYLDISTGLLTGGGGGAFGLVRYHLVTRREALASRSADLFSSSASSPAAASAAGGGGPDGDGAGAGRASAPDGVAARVERLTWERLLGNRDVIHRWPEALAIMAQPSHVPTSLRELALLADEICHLAGEASVDESWYGRRGTLATIYASSELFMTGDRSAGHADTRAFLRRRLEETAEVSGALRSAARWVGFTLGAGINVLRSKGARI